MPGTVPSKREIARCLRKYRYDAGMTASEAARAINKQAGTLYKYESAKLEISKEDVITLLALYGVDLDSAFSTIPGKTSGESRKKNMDAKHLRELESIWLELPQEGRARLLEVGRWALDHYRAKTD